MSAKLGNFGRPERCVVHRHAPFTRFYASSTCIFSSLSRSPLRAPQGLNIVRDRSVADKGECGHAAAEKVVTGLF